MMGVQKEKDPNRGLKLVVISMGMLLIGGTILLFVMAFKKMNDRTHQEIADLRIPPAYRECGEHTLTLPAGYVLKTVKFDGKVARLVATTDAGEWVIVLADSCSGHQLGALSVRRGQATETSK